MSTCLGVAVFEGQLAKCLNSYVFIIKYKKYQLEMHVLPLYRNLTTYIIKQLLAMTLYSTVAKSTVQYISGVHFLFVCCFFQITLEYSSFPSGFCKFAITKRFMIFRRFLADFCIITVFILTKAFLSSCCVKLNTAYHIKQLVSSII